MRRTLKFCAILCFVAIVGGKRWIHSIAGPYNLVSKRIFDCEPGEHGFDGTNTYRVRISHFNPAKPEDPQFLFGNVTRSQPMNDSFWYSVNLAIWTNNQWKSNALLFRVKTGACSFEYQNQPEMFFATGGSVSKGRCLKREGTFVLSGQKLDKSFAGFPALPYGRYRSLELYGEPDSEKATVCVYDEVDIIPKTS